LVRSGKEHKLKRAGILNRDISEVVASMGHLDTLMICDAGLPIPQNVRRIDLAIKPGLPGLIETTEAIANELKIDRILIAEEAAKMSPGIVEELKGIFTGIEFEFIPHIKLKELSQYTRAIVRTGEFTPYANVILVSGVVF
jgi:D-ribose pyranase